MTSYRSTTKEHESTFWGNASVLFPNASRAVRLWPLVSLRSAVRLPLSQPPQRPEPPCASLRGNDETRAQEIPRSPEAQSPPVPSLCTPAGRSMSSGTQRRPSAPRGFLRCAEGRGPSLLKRKATPKTRQRPTGPVTEEKTKGTHKKKVKGPSAPKRPPSAFFLCGSEDRATVKGEHPGLPMGDAAEKRGQTCSDAAAGTSSLATRRPLSRRKSTERILLLTERKGSPMQ